jgi:hypothetical protein
MSELLKKIKKLLEEKEEVDLEVIEISDERINLLADYLEINPTEIISGAEFHNNNNNHFDDIYVVLEDQSEYLVLDDDKAERLARNYARDYFEGENDISNYHLDNFVDTEYFNDFWKDSEQEDLKNMDDSELLEEAFHVGILTDADFETTESGYIDYEKPKENVDIGNVFDKLLEHRMGQYTDGVDWYTSNFGKEDFRQFVEDKNLLDIEAMIDDELNTNGRGMYIATYDSQEIYLGKINGIDMYAYRVD